MPTGQELAEDTAFVESQGFSLAELNKERARGTWVRPDGLEIPGLPVDPYHRDVYRKKGWTLKAPGETRAVVEAEEIVATPTNIPKHIHVMQPELGSECMVQGCKAVRLSPPAPKRTKRAKEQNNAR